MGFRAEGVRVRRVSDLRSLVSGIGFRVSIRGFRFGVFGFWSTPKSWFRIGGQPVSGPTSDSFGSWVSRFRIRPRPVSDRDVVMLDAGRAGPRRLKLEDPDPGPCKNP